MSIKGYRTLSQQETDQVNELKYLESRVMKSLDDTCEHMQPDNRWMAIARTDIEKGFMAAVRSITKPEPL